MRLTSVSTYGYMDDGCKGVKLAPEVEDSQRETKHTVYLYITQNGYTTQAWHVSTSFDYLLTYHATALTPIKPDCTFPANCITIHTFARSKKPWQNIVNDVGLLPCVLILMATAYDSTRGNR
jgi:hypothetical protein